MSHVWRSAVATTRSSIPALISICVSLTASMNLKATDPSNVRAIAQVVAIGGSLLGPRRAGPDSPSPIADLRKDDAPSSARHHLVPFRLERLHQRVKFDLLARGGGS
jgi:hypothetical protein